MKLKYQLAIMDMGEEFAAVPVGEDAAKFHGMIKMNAVSAYILDLLKEDTDPERVRRQLKEKYPDSSDGEIGEKLDAFLDKLISEGLLDD